MTEYEKVEVSSLSSGKERARIRDKRDFPGELLCGWVVYEVDALLDIALQSGLARFKELLLIGVQFREDVVSFLGSRGLKDVSEKSSTNFGALRTPSSTGTEK